jgi:hypothetical protein
LEEIKKGGRRERELQEGGEQSRKGRLEIEGRRRKERGGELGGV